jgi:AcrR family transcriptional regulator
MVSGAPGSNEAETERASSWRDRAVERSLRSARAKAVSRSDRFIQAAIEILTETGRTDFTVQELIERSKTSLRSFYQHFSGKEELLLALFEEVIGTSVAEWREEIEPITDSLEALHLLVDRIHGHAGQQSDNRIQRALAVYHLQLAESRPMEYARVLAPLRELILELVQRGVAVDGRFRDDIGPEALAMIMMQTVVGAAHMHALGAEPSGLRLDTEQLWAFCASGLIGTPPNARSPKLARRKR